MNTTSLSLLRRLKDDAGSSAWTRFVELYAPLILRTAVRAGIPPRDAEDVVQDVLSIVVKELRSFQYDSAKSFRGWLATVTRNSCIDSFRRLGRRPHPTRDGEIDVEVTDTVTQFTDAEYRRHVVGRAMELMQSEFEESTWKACWACVVEGRSATEVAESHQITVNAVYLSKSRVLRRLRQELDGLLD